MNPITPTPAPGFKRSTTARGMEPYNAVNAIAMRHGKPECDRKILAELNAIAPREGSENVDRQVTLD